MSVNEVFDFVCKHYYSKILGKLSSESILDC